MGIGFSLPAIEADPESADQRRPPPYTYNASYIKTFPAILKIAQITCSLIAFICAILAPFWPYGSYGGYHFFTAICQMYMWGVIIFFIGTTFNVKPYYSRWLLWEFAFYLFSSCSFAIGFIIAAALAGNSYMRASAAFGFFCILFYGIGTRTTYKDWRASSESMYNRMEENGAPRRNSNCSYQSEDRVSVEQKHSPQLTNTGSLQRSSGASQQSHNSRSSQPKSKDGPPLPSIHPPVVVVPYYR